MRVKKSLRELAEVLIQFIGFLLVWMFFYGICSMLVLLFVFDLDFGNPFSVERSPTYLLVSQLFALVGALVTLVIFEPKTVRLKSYFIDRLSKTEFRQLQLGAVTSVAVITASFFVIYATQAIQLQAHAPASLFTSIPIFLLIGITEEVIFRGVLLRDLLKIISPGAAIFVSSLVFAVVHIPNPNFGFIGFVTLFVSGLALGLLYAKTENLSAPIAAHVVWNLLQNILGFNVSGHVLAGVFSIDHQQKTDWLTGGAFGLEGSLVTLFFSCCLVAWLWLNWLPKTKES